MEEDSDSVNPFGPADAVDHNPFKSNAIGSSYQSSAYESNSMEEKLLPVPSSAQSIAQQKKHSPYYITSAYDDDEDPEDDEEDDVRDDWDNMTDAQLDRKEEELRRKEKQLLQHQRDLELREQEALASGGPPDNWPCAAYPIAYHDIADEIPKLYQPLCRRMYGLCLLTFLTLTWNWLCLMAFWTADYQKGSGPFLWGSIFVLCGIPGAWKMWYRNLYYTLKQKRVRLWFCFFFWFFCHTCFSLAAAIGVPGSYLVGVIHMIDAFSNASSGLGFMALICCVFWCLEAYLSVRWIRECWGIYQKAGHSSSELIAEGTKILAQPA